MYPKAKIGLFILLFALLWVPLVQEKTKYFKEIDLKGAFVPPTEPEFSLDSLIELKFQKQYEDYKNFNFGLKSLLVRIRNSFNYLVFKELSNKDYICGRNNFIFETNHIKLSLGLVYNGKEKNTATIDKIKFLKEGLEKRRVKFLCLMVPSKEVAASDYLPSHFRNLKQGENNFSDFEEGFKKNNIPFLDYGKYMASIKEGQTAFPLYTKTGSHWSMYGASRAQDTLLGYLQAMLGKPFPKYQRTGVEESDTARGDDKDYEKALNLLFSLNQPKYLYPKLEMVESTKNNYRPKIIFIGDSFFWQLRDLKMFKYIFSDDSKFWYYFANTSAPMGDQPWGSIKELNIIKELESADCVILEGSTGTSDWYPYGLADYYYENVVDPRIVEMVKQNIRGNVGWVTSLRNGSSATEDELINIESKRVCRDRKTFSIQASNDKFISAGGDTDKELIANRDLASDWETFSMVELANDKVAIYSHKNKFLSAELAQKGEITSTRTNIGDWEMLVVEGLGNGYVAFKASNGKYLSLDQKSFQLIANSNSIGKNEKFKLVIKT